MEGGSFLLMNSWGQEWGKGGFAWVRYSDFKDFNVEAYGLYPMGDASAKKATKFSGSFGLEMNDGRKRITLNPVSDRYFETAQKITSKDKFKVEFTNNVECYTYVFGQELDGSTYVLFPYTPKHSPYCGITGTRLFPRDYSMQPDDKGTKDHFAIVVTREPLDYEKLNKKISSASGQSMEDKLKSALGATSTGMKMKREGSTIQFETELNDISPIYFIIAVNK